MISEEKVVYTGDTFVRHDWSVWRWPHRPTSTEKPFPQHPLLLSEGSKRVAAPLSLPSVCVFVCVAPLACLSHAAVLHHDQLLSTFR